MPVPDPLPAGLPRGARLAIAWAVFVTGGLMLYAVYERHGASDPPWPLGIVFPW